MLIRCIYCGHGIDVPPDASLRRVVCPACGSRFSLLAGGDAPPSPQGRTLRDPESSGDPSTDVATLDHRPSGGPTEVIPVENGETTGTRILEPTGRDEGPDATTDRLGRDDDAATSLTIARPSSGIDADADTELEPDDDLARPAHRVIGRFELVGLLGTGAFGSVWKAKDPTLHRFVALKMAHRGAFDPAEADRFFREARSAAQLRHPNIVGVHEVGRDAGRIFIVGDYVEGKTLQDVAEEGPLPFRETASIASKIARALHHAHERGVIHRDLKPSNVMIDTKGEPIVMDFGLARRESGETSVTLEGRIMGTPNYMSPEQAAGRGHQADRRSDVYSLGVVLFRLCTGELPFRGNFASLIAQIIAEEPPHPAKLNNLAPRDLTTICLKCLRKEPDRRYPTADQAADDLDRWLKGEPILARDVGRVERFVRWCRRKPALAALSALAVVLALSTFLAILVGYVQTRSRLRDSLLSQARADRQTLDSGRSWSAAKALEDAARIRPGADLREEYLRVLDLPDFRFESLTPNPRFANYAPALTAILGGRRALMIKLVGGAESMELGSPETREALPDLGEFDKAARVSPDGRTLVATRRDGSSTEVWDLAGRSRLGILKDSGGQAVVGLRLAFAPDSRRIAALFEVKRERFLATFDPRTYAADWIAPFPRLVTDSLNFLPGGQGLALTCLTDYDDPEKSKQWVEIHRPGRPGSTRLLVDSNVLHIPMNHEPRRVSFQADARGTRMAVAGVSGSIKVWDLGPFLLGTGEPREALAIKAASDALMTVQYSPGGDVLAAFGMDGRLRLHDAETGELLVSGLFAMPGEVPWLMARPQWIDRERIVGESMRGLLVFRVRRPLSRPARLVRRDNPRAAPVPTGLRFAPSERWLACSMPPGQAGLVDLASRDATPKALDAPCTDSTVGFGRASDRFFVAGSKQGLRTFDVETGRVLDAKPPVVGLDHLRAAGSDERGHVLVGGSETAHHMPAGSRFRLWDFDEGRSRITLELTRVVPDPRDPRRTLRFEPDSIPIRPRFSADGTHVGLQESVQGGGGLTLIRLFDLATGSKVDEFFTPKLGPFALANRAGLIAVGQGSGVDLIRRDRRGEVATLPAPETEVRGLAVDPAGRRVASFATREGVIRLWDADRGVNVATFHVGHATLGDVAISPTGRWLAASDGRGRLRVWDLDEVRRVLAEADLAW